MVCIVEDTKKLAEAVWVVKHAMECNCDGRTKKGVCCIAQCATAKKILRIIEEEDREGMKFEELPDDLEKSIEFVRTVLDHRCNGCLLCALVERARASVVLSQRNDEPSWYVHLDYSKNVNGPNFNVSLPKNVSGSIQKSHTVSAPDLRRSTTTEELAHLLSDLSGRGESKNEGFESTRHRIVSEESLKNMNTLCEKKHFYLGDKINESARTHKTNKKRRIIFESPSNESTIKNNMNSSCRKKQRRSVRPPSRYRDDDSSEHEVDYFSPRDNSDEDNDEFNDIVQFEADSNLHMMLPPPSENDGLYTHDTRVSRIAPRNNAHISSSAIFGAPPPMVKPLLPSVIAATKSADFVQRSPSFSAAASSLLALTGGRKSQFSPASNPVLMPRC